MGSCLVPNAGHIILHTLCATNGQYRLTNFHQFGVELQTWGFDVPLHNIMKARCQSRLPETATLVSTFSGPRSDFRLSAGELSAVTSCDMGTPVLVPVSTY